MKAISLPHKNLLLLIIFSAFAFSCTNIDNSDQHIYGNISDLGEEFNSLPIVWLETKNVAQTIDEEDYVPITFSLVDSNNFANNVFVLSGGIRGRGNNSWDYPKKPYRIKFNVKTSLFGLEAAKNWILLAEYRDPTLIMNAVAFELGRQVFDLPYTHSYHHVHLFLNGEYRGVYGLTEHNEVGEGRVDIDEDKGWFVNIDSYYDEEPKFRTKNYDLPIMIKSPEVNNNQINNPVFDFVKKDINELCDSLASENFPENGYRDLIDMNTFIDFLMVNEIVMNGELLHPKSVYLYKDKDGKISMGPLWDFDWAFNWSSDWAFKYYEYASDYYEYTATFFKSYEGYLIKNIYHDFFARFFEDPVFGAKFKERWNEKYAEILDVVDFIDSLGAKLEQPAEENFKIWNPSNNYGEQIKKMKEWWNNRVNRLNEEI